LREGAVFEKKKSQPTSQSKITPFTKKKRPPDDSNLTVLSDDMPAPDTLYRKKLPSGVWQHYHVDDTVQHREKERCDTFAYSSDIDMWNTTFDMLVRFQLRFIHWLGTFKH